MEVLNTDVLGPRKPSDDLHYHNLFSILIYIHLFHIYIHTYIHIVYVPVLC